MIYPEHIQWIIDNRTEALNQSLSQDNSYKTIDNPLDVILSADPTSKKKLTQWLVDTYINGGFRWEDIESGSKSKVFDTLSLYIKHKSKLDSTNHIGQYDTLGSVYKDIVSFIKSEKSGRSAKRDEQAQAYEESELLIKSDSLTVVIPKTEYASKWWGRGTQWCTAGNKNNVFFDYFKNGPLIIIIINDVKIQLYIDLINNNCLIQFMDEHDCKVELKFVEDNWTLLSPIMKWAVKQDGKVLEYIPKDLITLDLCIEAVKKNGDILSYIPKRFKKEELYLEAVKQNGNSLRNIPKNLITLELCLQAVKQNGNSFCYVPDHLITAELCLMAVSYTGFNLRYVPENFRTAELCLEAVKSYGNALGYTPKSFRTPELCLEAIKSKGEALSFIPENLRTAELYLEVVKHNGFSLRDIPEALRTKELCLEAVKSKGDALGNTPEPLKTPELCLEAVRKDGRALIYIPKSLRTAELCLEAVRQNGLALKFIPESLKTAEIYLEAVRKNGIVLGDVPKNLITLEMCLGAIKQDARALEYIPENFRTSELYLESELSLKSFGYRSILNYVPEQYKRQFAKRFEPRWDLNIIKGLRLEIENENFLKSNMDKILP